MIRPAFRHVNRLTEIVSSDGSSPSALRPTGLQASSISNNHYGRDLFFLVTCYDSFMRTVARTLRRLVAIYCPSCPGLSEDETYLLHAASLAQMADTARAEAVLRRMPIRDEQRSFL